MTDLKTKEAAWALIQQEMATIDRSKSHEEKMQALRERLPELKAQFAAEVGG